jgi:hypothetical protein
MYFNKEIKKIVAFVNFGGRKNYIEISDCGNIIGLDNINNDIASIKDRIKQESVNNKK